MLIISQSPGYLETLLGKFGLDGLALDILGELPIDNFLMTVGGSRLSGQNGPRADIDLYGFFVPPLQDLTMFDTLELTHRKTFVVPSETGAVNLEVGLTLRTVQKAMSEAHNFSGHVWTQLMVLARYDREYEFHESSDKGGGYNARHALEDTVIRMVPHLPRFALETHYRGQAGAYLKSMRKEVGRNERADIEKYARRAYHLLAMWRDSRVGWPVGEVRWETLQKMDHAVPMSAFDREAAIPERTAGDIVSDFEAELALVPAAEMDPVIGEQFQARFRKLVSPALKRLYKF